MLATSIPPQSQGCSMRESMPGAARLRLENHIADLKDTISYLESRVGLSPFGDIVPEKYWSNWKEYLKHKLAESSEDLRELA